MPNNNDDLSEQLKRDDDRTPKPPTPPPCDRSDAADDADSGPPLRCDPSTATQDFLRDQRDKLLKLIQSQPNAKERIRDHYLTHLVGQFHIVRRGDWDLFWALINGLHGLDKSFHKGSILLGGWKAKVSQLQPPTSLSDHVTAFATLPDEFYERFQRLWIYGEAVRLHRLYIKACDTNRAECPRWANNFEKWTKQHHHIFHPAGRFTSSPWDYYPKTNPTPPDVSFAEIDQFIRSGQFTELQDKAEGWIHQHSNTKAIHFTPIDTPSQGWEEFHRFCRSFDYLDKPRKDSFCFYFLIQLPSAL